MHVSAHTWDIQTIRNAVNVFGIIVLSAIVPSYRGVYGLQNNTDSIHFTSVFPVTCSVPLKRLDEEEAPSRQWEITQRAQGRESQRDHKKEQTGDSQKMPAQLQKDWEGLPEPDYKETVGTQQLKSRICLQSDGGQEENSA